MLLLKIFSILATLLTSIAANSERFNPLIIRSGSLLQHSGVYANDDYLYLGRGNYSLSAVVTDCGFLLFDDGSYASVNNNGEIKRSSREHATNTFAIKNGHLTFFNADGFEAVPKGNKYLLSTKSTAESLSIVIRAQSLTKGYPVPSFVAANNCSTHAQLPSELNAAVENYSLNGSICSPEDEQDEVEDYATELKNPWKIGIFIVTLLATIAL